MGAELEFKAVRIGHPCLTGLKQNIVPCHLLNEQKTIQCPLNIIC